MHNALIGHLSCGQCVMRLSCATFHCVVCKGPCCIDMYVPSVPSESHGFTLSQVAYMRVMNKSLSSHINTV